MSPSSRMSAKRSMGASPKVSRNQPCRNAYLLVEQFVLTEVGLYLFDGDGQFRKCMQRTYVAAVRGVRRKIMRWQPGKGIRDPDHPVVALPGSQYGSHEDACPAAPDPRFNKSPGIRSNRTRSVSDRRLRRRRAPIIVCALRG